MKSGGYIRGRLTHNIVWIKWSGSSAGAYRFVSGVDLAAELRPADVAFNGDDRGRGFNIRYATDIHPVTSKMVSSRVDNYFKRYSKRPGKQSAAHTANSSSSSPPITPRRANNSTTIVIIPTPPKIQENTISDKFTYKLKVAL
ncbi:hypothetical protein IJI76_01470 [Candidatus Saccharibacteria bacterium]|nr:hypothetical protein [Candidatus Saccharibacteria bacterium]